MRPPALQAMASAARRNTDIITGNFRFDAPLPLSPGVGSFNVSGVDPFEFVGVWGTIRFPQPVTIHAVEIEGHFSVLTLEPLATIPFSLLPPGSTFNEQFIYNSTPDNSQPITVRLLTDSSGLASVVPPPNEVWRVSENVGVRNGTLNAGVLFDGQMLSHPVLGSFVQSGLFTQWSIPRPNFRPTRWSRKFGTDNSVAVKNDLTLVSNRPFTAWSSQVGSIIKAQTPLPSLFGFITIDVTYSFIPQ